MPEKFLGGQAKFWGGSAPPLAPPLLVAYMIVVNCVTTGPLRATIQYNWPSQGNCNVDMALSENEFDTLL